MDSEGIHALVRGPLRCWSRTWGGVSWPNMSVSVHFGCPPDALGWRDLQDTGDSERRVGQGPASLGARGSICRPGRGPETPWRGDMEPAEAKQQMRQVDATFQVLKQIPSLAITADSHHAALIGVAGKARLIRQGSVRMHLKAAIAGLRICSRKGWKTERRVPSGPLALASWHRPRRIGDSKTPDPYTPESCLCRGQST